MSFWDTLPRPSPLACAGGCLWTPQWWWEGLPSPRGPLASPSSGSRPPPLGRRRWSAVRAGPPAAADTSLGRTYKRSAPDALGPEEEEESRGSISASSYPSRTKGTPLPGLAPLCLPPRPLCTSGLQRVLTRAPFLEAPPLSSSPSLLPSYLPRGSPISVREA